MKSHTTALFAAAFAAPAALGAVDFYDSRAAFDAVITSQAIETFESESTGDLTPPTLFDSGLTVGLTSGAVSNYIATSSPYGFENTTAGGENFLAFGRNPAAGGTETGSYTVQFTFGASVTGFGFDLSGFESPADGFNVTILNGGQIVDDFFQPSDQLFGVRFYGFVSDVSFDEFRVNVPVLTGGTADYVAFDDVTWGVPTPGTAALLGLGAIAGVRRRR